MSMIRYGRRFRLPLLAILAIGVLFETPTAHASAVIALQQVGVNGGAFTTVATGTDFTAAAFSGTYGNFQVAIASVSSTNGAVQSDLLSATTSIKNIGDSAATLNIRVSQDNYTLPTGLPLVIESSLGGTISAGILDLTNIFQVNASSTNNQTFDFGTGLQSATSNGSTFATGSVTGIFNHPLGDPYSLANTVTIDLSAGGQINYSSHVGVTDPAIPSAVPEPASFFVFLTGLSAVGYRWLRRRNSVSPA